LNTPNKTAAADTARQIYVSLIGAGWESTLAKFKSSSTAPAPNKLTVGEFIAAVESTGLVNPKTLRNYVVCLRTIVVQVFGLKDGADKYDYKTGGHEQWLARIHKIQLSKLTPAMVDKWRRMKLTQAGNSPLEQAKWKRNINSIVRCARALFSKSVIKKLGHIKLPSPLPFTDIEMFEAGSMRYQSKINAQALIAAARHEIMESDPEAYGIFLLGLFAGLRKAEIDSLEWRMIDFESGVIHLEESEFLHLKTAGSADEIPIENETIEELRAMKAKSTSAFVVPSDRAARSDVVYTRYRCHLAFERLYKWLRGKGVTAQKPLHELRKELGAIIASEQGIFAASHALRHADIGITSRHYTDQKKRVVSGLGKFLHTELKAMPDSAAQA
jgi:integrase